MSEDPTQHFQNGDLRVIRERLESIDGRLVTLEERVDRRLMETRPIWESVLEQLSGVREQLKEMNARQSRVEDENKDFRRMFRSAFSDLSRVQGDFEERMDRLEERNIQQ